MGQILRYFVAILFLSIGGVMSVLAGEREQQVLTVLFSDVPVSEAMFAPEFLGQVPITQIGIIIAQIKQEMGDIVDINFDGSRYEVKSTSHELPAEIALNAKGQIIGLLFQSVILSGQSTKDVLAEMRKLEGEVAYSVIRQGQSIYQHNGELPLAVGSTFKIAVLAVLAQRIKDGDARWDNVVRLEEKHISFPSGVLQNWGVGAPLTLNSLAAMMISISDNTGTDALLDFVGRKAVAAKLGTDFVIKTRELFILKADKELQARFLAADTVGKWAMVAEMDAHGLPDPEEATVPHIQGVEYYVSTDKLCALMAEVSKLDVMTINPGIAAKQDWQRVAFKGGSEIGVINFTTEVTGADGVPICVALTWNAPMTVDQNHAASLYATLFQKLAEDF